MPLTWRTPLVILVSGAAVLTLSFGIRTSFGLFLSPMSADLGWGREVFALAIAVQNLVWGFSQPFVGAIADRYGSGRVVALCGAMYALGLYLMAASATPLAFNLSAGVLIGLALSGTGFPVVLAVVGRSVDERRRSLFLGIASAGGSSGQILMVPLAQLFLDGFGWTTAFVLLALVSALMVPLAASLTGRPAEPAGGARQSLAEAVREAGGHRGYWYLTAAFFVCGFHVAFIATHLPAFIVDRGEAAALGAVALTLIGLGNVVGSLFWGALGGRFRKKFVLSTLYLGRAVVISAFVMTPVSDVSIMIFSAAIGWLWLGTVPLTSGLVAQIFGVRYMATLFGFVFFSHQLGSFLGAWLGGYVYDTTGSYLAVWWVAVALALVAGALHFPINDRPMARLALAPG
ncbi:MAG: MFS transporter [Gammaproteobacteria bacterium]|nr:MFS transporter [Gammaproteobacteria bacterium]